MTTCARCGRDKHRGRCKQSFIEAVGALPEPPPPVHVNGARALEVMRGWGFRASIEDGQFVIEQDSVDEAGATRTDNVTLAPHEARQLVDWIAEQVEEKP